MKKIVIKLTRGSETMNPAKTGFLNDNQLAKEMTNADKKILNKKNN